MAAAKASLADRVVPEEQFYDAAAEQQFSSEKTNNDATRSARTTASATKFGSTTVDAKEARWGHHEELIQLASSHGHHEGHEHHGRHETNAMPTAMPADTNFDSGSAEELIEGITSSDNQQPWQQGYASCFGDYQSIMPSNAVACGKVVNCGINRCAHLGAVTGMGSFMDGEDFTYTTVRLATLVDTTILLRPYSS